MVLSQQYKAIYAIPYLINGIAIGYKDIEIAKLLEDTITVVERINIQVNGNFFNITVYIFFKES